MIVKKINLHYAMAYLNGPFHAGHLSLYYSADIKRRLEALKGNHSKLYNAYHSTGQPIMISLENLRNGKELEYIKFTHKNIEFKQWIEKHIEFNNSCLDKLGIEYDKKDIFTTTDLNILYSEFVNWQFNVLYEKGLIEKKDHPLIFCENCNIPLGDHERKEGEGVFLKDIVYDFKVENNLIILQKEKVKNLKTYEIFINEKVFFLKASEKFYHRNKLIIVKLLQENLSFLVSDFKITLTTFEEDVICRCGHEGIIFLEKDQYFIKYNDPTWKREVNEFIINSDKIDYGVKLILLKKSDELRSWPFSRTLGFGTKWLKNETKLIESLSDSALHIYFSLFYNLIKINRGKIKDIQNFYNFLLLDTELNTENLVNKSNLIKLKEQILENNGFGIYILGKDLIQNHLLFSIYFYKLLIKTLNFPLIKIKGHILFNNEKMSKSKGIGLFVDDILKKNHDLMRLSLGCAHDFIDDANLTDKLIKENEIALKNLQKETLSTIQEKQILNLTKYYESCIKYKFFQFFLSVENLNLKNAFVILNHDLKKLLKNFDNQNYNLVRLYFLQAFAPNSIHLLESDILKAKEFYFQNFTDIDYYNLNKRKILIQNQEFKNKRNFLDFFEKTISSFILKKKIKNNTIILINRVNANILFLEEDIILILNEMYPNYIFKEMTTPIIKNNKKDDFKFIFPKIYIN